MIQLTFRETEKLLKVFIINENIKQNTSKAVQPSMIVSPHHSITTLLLLLHPANALSDLQFLPNAGRDSFYLRSKITMSDICHGAGICWKWSWFCPISIAIPCFFVQFALGRKQGSSPVSQNSGANFITCFFYSVTVLALLMQLPSLVIAITFNQDIPKYNIQEFQLL